MKCGSEHVVNTEMMFRRDSLPRTDRVAEKTACSILPAAVQASPIGTECRRRRAAEGLRSMLRIPAEWVDM
jgi:hypothetical protein